MVVGVEPFGHFARNHVNTVFLVTTGHGEIQIQRISAFQRIIAGWNGAEHLGVVQYLVIESKITAGDEVNASIMLTLPVFRTNVFGNMEQIGRLNRTFPVAFLRFFQLAMRADTWESKVCGSSHVCSPGSG